MNTNRIPTRVLHELHDNDEVGIGVYSDPEVLRQILNGDTYYIFTVKSVPNVIIIDSDDEMVEDRSSIKQENIPRHPEETTPFDNGRANQAGVPIVAENNRMIEPRPSTSYEIVVENGRAKQENVSVTPNKEEMDVEANEENGNGENSTSGSLVKEEQIEIGPHSSREGEQLAAVRELKNEEDMPIMQSGANYDEDESIAIDDSDDDLVLSQLLTTDAPKQEEREVSDNMFYNIKKELEEMDKLGTEVERSPVEIDSDSSCDVVQQLESAINELGDVCIHIILLSPI